MNNNNNKLVSKLEFKANRDKIYEIKAIQDSMVYANTNKEG